MTDDGGNGKSGGNGGNGGDGVRSVPMVTITVNGRELVVPEDYPVIQAALDNGILIPHYCYHPDIGIDGNCRMCLGEVEGAPKLAATCTLPAADGLVVRTDTERVKEAVQGTLEFILVNHPIDCPVCDQAGECDLQDYYVLFGMHRSKIPLADKVRKPKVVDLGQRIVLDAERCVLCSRCTRFTDRVSGSRELRFRQRGNRTEIGTFEGRQLESHYSGNLADLCPVGALTSRDFRFRKRVWMLESTDSVCGGCSTGCSIRIDQDENRIYRYVPRRNSWINASWMCDMGRLSYTEVTENRLTMPLLREPGGGAGAPVPWEKALDWSARRIREAREEEPRRILAIATPCVTTEELYLFGRFAREILQTTHIDYRVSSTCEGPSALEDDLLYRRDHFPNSRGAEVLGLVPAEAPEFVGSGGGGFKLVYLLGADRIAGDRVDRIRALLEGAECVIAHAARECELLDLVDLTLPVSMLPEKEGTLVNHAGRLQRIAPAVAPPGEAEPDGRVLCLVAEKIGERPGKSAPAHVFAEMAAEVEAFRGIEWGAIGPTGVQLRGFEAVRPRVTEVSVAPQLTG